MVAALKHGRNSLGIELDTAYCKMAAARLMDESSSIFGNAHLQIELKSQAAVDEEAAVLKERGPEYSAAAIKKRRKIKPSH
jgi:site-specific DNA-methyltransferase (adenine-specific)